MVKGNILIVDDNEEILVALKMFLGEHFTIVHTQSNPDSALAELKEKLADVVILDMNFSAGQNSGREGLDLMRSIREIDPRAVIIFITAYGTIDLAVTALKEGATDFIVKPWEDQKLLATIKTAMELSKSRQELYFLREQQQFLHSDKYKDHNLIYGNSVAMKEVMNAVDKVAKTNASVIIQGENGTGKELVARELHLRSTRKNEVFIRVDLGSLPGSLFESEMFGYVKGAFTDAYQDKIGRFELASKGTLFLDEIGNISLELQSKLLGVLENKEVTRLGSNSPTVIDTRIISATNMDLDQMAYEHTFREDLLYRLNTIRIDIPPLRERLEDLPLLVDFFLSRMGDKYNKPIRISSGALKRLAKHTWPGNIRELQHTLEKTVILADHGILTERDFLLKTRPVPPDDINTVNLKENEKEIILRAIKINAGNLSQAARHLGISRKTLYDKIKKYEI